MNHQRSMPQLFFMNSLSAMQYALEIQKPQKLYPSDHTPIRTDSRLPDLSSLRPTSTEEFSFSIKMFYVLFSSVTPSEKSALGGRFYNTLQPLLSDIDGFVDEIPFEEPGNPEASCLFARFANENALTAWRNHPTHLRIMHHARHKLFERFRVTVGTAQPRSSTTGTGEQNAVVVYQRPTTQDLHPEHMQLQHVASSTAVEMTTDFIFYIGDDISIWVSRLKPGSDVAEFEASLKRVPNDAIHRIYVLRDYTKDDRREAPVDIDDAEEKAGLLREHSEDKERM